MRAALPENWIRAVSVDVVVDVGMLVSGLVGQLMVRFCVMVFAAKLFTPNRPLV